MSDHERLWRGGSEAERDANAEPAGARQRLAELPAAPGAGTPMPAPVQAKMETAFGADFSAVRIHESERADAIGAQAYTQGPDIQFSPGQYQPHTEAGQALLGHELAHVVQQSQGRVGATAQARGLAVNDDDGLEREADEAGAQAARGEAVTGLAAGGGGSVQRSAAGPVQMKGWVWRAAGKKWDEVDPDERGRPVPGHIHADNDGEVYDPDTERWYRNVGEYQRYTGRIVNPPFERREQTEEELAGLSARGARVAPAPGASGKLHSFLDKGVLKPSDVDGEVTTSADEKSRPDQISVNKFGPFNSRDEVERTAAYAATNPANGAIPVVMENGVDRIPPDETPDLGALAARAHNSALAIIDPSALPRGAQPAVNLAGTGEMTLTSSIPASCFVTVLVPIQLMHLMSPSDVARYKIRFVGSRMSRVQYNYKTTAKASESMLIDTAVPDYQGALEQIFADNRGCQLLTHVIRLSPKVPLPTRADASSSSLDLSALAEALPEKRKDADEDEQEKAPDSPRPSASVTAVPSALPAPDEASSSPLAPGEARRVANVVRDRYADVFSLGETPIASVDDLVRLHAGDGVTRANAAAVYAELEDEGFWFC